jgi:polyisoprenoid-binding protein YceI
MHNHTQPRPLSIWRTIFWMTFLLIPFALSSQTYKLSGSEGEVMVTGTSTLHDWEEIAEKKSGSIGLDVSGELPTITALKFAVESESLKSGKSGMDKNTYKALDTDKHKEIVYQMTSVKSISKITSPANTYKVVATGNLTIAGHTNKVDLPFNLTVNGSKVTLDGKYGMKMTSFGIEPPKALMGTIKTGDEIEIHYTTIWK